jgi:5-formyltetrahydrofolate cyclo-ligase
MTLSKDPTILQSKEALRREIKSALLNTSPDFLRLESMRLCQTISARTVWQNSGVILCYAPIRQEVDIWPLVATSVQKGRSVCLPRYLPQKDAYEAALITNMDSDLVNGRFGVREPAAHCPALPLNRLDFIMVPGVAFDPSGCRLGRGRGYYDRLLSATRGIRCGVAYEQQIRSKIPVEPHDIHVDYVATPLRWIVVSPHAAS